MNQRPSGLTQPEDPAASTPRCSAATAGLDCGRVGDLGEQPAHSRIDRAFIELENVSAYLLDPPGDSESMKHAAFSDSDLSTTATH